MLFDFLAADNYHTPYSVGHMLCLERAVPTTSMAGQLTCHRYFRYSC